MVWVGQGHKRSFILYSRSSVPEVHIAALRELEGVGAAIVLGFRVTPLALVLCRQKVHVLNEDYDLTLGKYDAYSYPQHCHINRETRYVHCPSVHLGISKADTGIAIVSSPVVQLSDIDCT